VLHRLDGSAIAALKLVVGSRSAGLRLRGYAKQGIMHMATNRDADKRRPRPVFWVASSRKDLRKFPKAVRQTVGQALFDAQTGGKHPDAKPLRGFHGAGVLEVTASADRGTYRVVYIVKFSGAVYVLHAFQKKSKRGSKVPAEEIEKVKARLKEAEKHHADWAKRQQGEDEGHL
jgi:phage-related protein